MKVLFVIWICICACLANAHDLSLTRVVVGGRDVQLVTPVSKLVTLSGLGSNPSAEWIDQAVRQRLTLEVDGRRFEPKAAKLDIDLNNDVLLWTAYLDRPFHKVRLDTPFFSEDIHSRTLLKVGSNPDVLVEAKSVDSQNSSVGRSIASFCQMGVGHILTGFDHILFVLGLVMLGGSLSSLFKTMTMFTIAHSFSLTLAAMGVIHPNPQIVEPLIALSIMAVAVENLRNQTKSESKTDYRLGIAFSFGLVHGLGFSEALMHIGLKGKELALSIASFNIGVELGQAMILMAGVGIGTLFARKWHRETNWAASAVSVLFGMIGCFWFASRLLF